MIQIIDIDSLVPFENHPFKERSGIEQQELTESIKENGLLEPIIVRPFPANKYEIISGHRRVEACKALGITSIPVIIKQLTRDEAIVQMVDSNIHREHMVEISYLSEYEQRTLLDQIEFTDATPSLSQAQRLRKFSQQGRYSTDVVFAVLCEEKPNQKEQVRFMEEDIRKYFPKSYTKSDMQKTIISLFEKWQRQRERNRRDER